RDRSESAAHEHVESDARAIAERIALYAEVLSGAEAIVDLHDVASAGGADAIERRRAGLEQLRERLSFDAPAFRALCDGIGDEWTERGALLELAPRHRSKHDRGGADAAIVEAESRTP